MPTFLYVFGFETPRQRQNNAANGWDDEDSHGVVIDAPDAAAALQWGDQIAQRYVALLHGQPEADWAASAYASFIENDPSHMAGHDGPRVAVGMYPDFNEWLVRDRR